MQAVVAHISCKQCTRILGIKYYSFELLTIERNHVCLLQTRQKLNGTHI